MVSVCAVATHFLKITGNGDTFPSSAVLSAGPGLGVEHEGAKIILCFFWSGSKRENVRGNE